MLHVKQFSDSILPLKDVHLLGPVEVHVKLFKWHFPDPENKRTSEEHIQTNLNQRMNLSGLGQRLQNVSFQLTNVNTLQSKLMYSGYRNDVLGRSL